MLRSAPVSFSANRSGNILTGKAQQINIGLSVKLCDKSNYNAGIWVAGRREND